MAKFVMETSLDFAEMYDSGTLVDLKIFCDDNDSKCHDVHKVVMAAASPYLKTIILESVSKDTTMPVAINLQMKYHIVKSVLEFIYKGNAKIDLEDLEDFTECSQVLQIKGLQEPVKEVKKEPVASTSKALPKIEPEDIKPEKMDTDQESESGALSVKPKKLKTEADVSEDAAKFAKQPDGKIACLLCLKSFNFIGNAKRHYKEKHTVSKDIFKCKYCQQEFKIKRFLNQHLLTAHKITQRMLKQAVG